MPILTDLTNMKFGKLTVTKLVQTKPVIYECRCECDTIVNVRADSLRSGHTKTCGAHREKQYIDITGQTINSHLVLGLAEIKTEGDSESPITFWHCQCINCGQKKIKKKWALRFGKGCKNCDMLPQGEAGFNLLLHVYKQGAKMRGLEFMLTETEFRTLTLSVCYYCGSLLSNVSRTCSKSDWGDYYYNGIDRKDNNLGYTLDNCVPCCKICNRGKLSMSLEDFNKYINNVRYGHKPVVEEIVERYKGNSPLPKGEQD